MAVWLDGTMQLKVKLSDGAPLPKHAKPGDAGLDLTSRDDAEIPPHGTTMVGTGVRVEIPSGYVGLCFPRSGLASKDGINLANCVGVVDSGYRGEIKAPLHNMTDEARRIERGQRVFQLVIMPFETVKCVEVGELSESDRGDGGFGSSGRV